MEFEKGIEQENPEYYKGLKTILKEFQEHLISKHIIDNSDFKNYAELLDKISVDKDKEYEIEYNISDSLQKLAKGLNYEGPSPESFVKGMKYLNATDSKSFLFNEKVSELIRKKEEYNRSVVATILLEIYDENDFELPMIKLKFFRFLDPNSNFVVTTYMGKPNLE
ncbi:hypothetical protein [Maribacter sp. 2308TA10-17]|uniref:hypothetical protein n=1 Tax=Maribacter sp. 2308TA10-17 TaxID=3386276 RepID=UPI0039BD7A93